MTDRYIVDLAGTLKSSFRIGALTAVLASRLIAVTTGDLTGGGDLSADRTLGLANTAVSAGTYGDAATVPEITVDAKGRITAAVGRPGDPSVLGAYDRADPAIYVASGLGTLQTLTVYTAEYNHLIDDCGSADTAAALISGGDFQPICHDSPAFRRAAGVAAQTR